MKKKLAYDNKRVYRKTIISQEEYDLIIEEGDAAYEILNEDRFEFVRQLLETSREYAKNSILENTITDVSEEVTISDNIKKIFSRKKKEQIDALSGQYVLVNKFFQDLQDRVDTRDQMLEGINNETILVQDDR